MKKDINFREMHRSRKNKKDPALDTCFCRLKIDNKTVIFCRTEESYNNWMRNYPTATKLGLNI